MNIDLVKLSREYPTIDLESVVILLQIAETPGYSIREIADILSLDRKHVQLKIALLASGRRNHPSSRHVLVTDDYNLGDPRKRSLSLTVAGEALVGKIINLTK